MSPGILEAMMVKTARPSHLFICRNRFPARNDPSREIWIGLTDAVLFVGHNAREMLGISSPDLIKERL